MRNSIGIRLYVCVCVSELEVDDEETRKKKHREYIVNRTHQY